MPKEQLVQTIKWANKLSRDFSKEEAQMANDCHQGTAKQNDIEILFCPVRMAIIKKTRNNKC
jgi:hypothetical protein